MRDKNTMSKVQFLFESLFWTCLTTWFYHRVFPVSLPHTKASVSLIVLCGVAMVMGGIGVAITWERRRNYMSLFVNVILPLEVYAILAFWKQLSLTTILLMAVSLTLSGFYGAFIMKNRENRRHMPAKVRLRYAILGSRTIIVFCMALIFISAAIVMFVGVPANDKETSESTWTIEKQRDAVFNLRKPTWDTLNGDQRFNTLEIVLKIEAANLGLPFQPKLEAAALDQTTIGKYDVSRKTILLNEDYVARCSSEQAVIGALHELFHVYQHELVNVLGEVPERDRNLAIFAGARTYTEELAHYHDGEGDDDFESYFEQRIEEDARAFGLSTAKAFMDYVYASDES